LARMKAWQRNARQSNKDQVFEWGWSASFRQIMVSNS
jgi:hypothetical protein